MLNYILTICCFVVIGIAVFLRITEGNAGGWAIATIPASIGLMVSVMTTLFANNNQCPVELKP